MPKLIFQTTRIITGERGAVAVIAAISMLVLVGFAAFAIDFGHAYVVKNRLQNAADAAALAGASVMFTSNTSCLESGSPFGCCDGANTGTCNPDVIIVSDVNSTAEAVEDLNPYGGDADKTTVTIEIGHYAFADAWDSPGTFVAASPSGGVINQLEDWKTTTFAALNGEDDYINAVKVTIKREDVNRFFSRIWSSEDDLSLTVQATAYIGFAGYLVPGAVDEPIAICRGAITDQTTGAYKCNVGTMLNNNTQTARWTNFDQANCGTADTNTTRPLICDGNPNPIVFGEGVSTTNGTVGNEMTDIFNCWKDTGKFDSTGDGVPDKSLDTSSLDASGNIVNTPDGKPDHPWQMLLPVVDCTTQGNCRTVLGAVMVNTLWINDKNDDAPDDKLNKEAWIPNVMYPAGGGTPWHCKPGTLNTATGTEWTEQGCWDYFRDTFGLQNNNLSGAALWEQKSLYFRPDCEVNIPTGGTGGDNYGIHAQYPVLVK